jgi:hypothetical protein
MTDPQPNIMLSFTPHNLAKGADILKNIMYKHIREMFHGRHDAASFYPSERFHFYEE